MIRLEPDECRVLGVLVEKALTTPGQYPLTSNGIVVGCSQKSNREPVEDYDEERVYNALDGLRNKGLVIEAHLSQSRVAKFRHNAREALRVETRELVLLAELLLRGPQTVGELRTRASRMKPLASIEEVSAALETLMAHDPPYVRELSQDLGSRARRFGQLLCPNLHPTGREALSHSASAVPPQVAGQARDELVQRVDRLEAELNDLRQAMVKLAESLGEPDLIQDKAAAPHVR